LTPLHRASRALNVEIVGEILEASKFAADVRTYPSRNPGGVTPLMGMCTLGVPKDAESRTAKGQIIGQLLAAMMKDWCFYTHGKSYIL